MELPSKTDRNFLTLNASDGVEVMRGLSSPVRVRILRLLHLRGPLNVNEISDALKLPQSTVATNVQVLESCDLIHTETVKATKGQQKLCAARYNEIILRFDDYDVKTQSNVIELSMPLGLYTNCSVSPPCGLCSSEAVIGLLDVPDFFLDPDRMKAGLIWFERGHVEYKFPNNARILQAEIEALEFSMELSSEVPGTNANWPSDISVWVNDVLVSTWTSPGDFGDKRGIYTPRWWKLEGSQYGHLKTWSISDARQLPRRQEGVVGDPRPAAPRGASFDPPARRHRRARQASGRHQHLRAGLWKLRPGHPAPPASEGWWRASRREPTKSGQRASARSPSLRQGATRPHER